MRESYIEKKVCEYATQRGWRSMKLNGIHDRGKPDRMFFAPSGRVKFVEFKAPGKRASALQERFINDLRGCGFDCYVIDSIESGRDLFDQ